MAPNKSAVPYATIETVFLDAGNTLISMEFRRLGDMYYQDVQGSRAAGVHSVLLDPYGDWEIDDCDRCRDLSELVGRFRGARA